MTMLDQIRRNIADLETRRVDVVAAMEDVTRTAESREEGERSLTAEEDVTFTERMGDVVAIDAELVDLEERAAALEAIEARSANAASRAPYINVAPDPRDMSTVAFGPNMRNELHGRVRRLLDEDNERRLTLSAAERESVDRLLRSADTKDAPIARHYLTHSSDEYRSAWTKVYSGNELLLTDVERGALVAARAASLTDAAGGYAVPVTTDVTIISTDAGSTSPMRQIASVRQTVTDTWNGVTSAGVTASWDAEAAEVSDDAPTLGTVAVTPAKGQMFVPFSVEVGMDWANMESDIRTMFQQAKDDLEATAFFTGDGSGKPEGVTVGLDGTASEIAPTTVEVFAPLTDLYLVEEALAARYRANAAWTANKAIYNDIRAANDNTHAFWERVGAAQPAQLLGYPAYEASAMDGAINAAATEDNFVLVLGDFMNGYVIVDRVGMSVELVPHLFATANNLPSGQRGLLAWFRTGGKVVNSGAFAMLSIPTTA